MKKIFMIVAALAALVFTSCEKDEIETDEIEDKPAPQIADAYSNQFGNTVKSSIKVMGYDYNIYFLTPPCYSWDYHCYYDDLYLTDYMTRICTYCNALYSSDENSRNELQSIGYFISDDLNSGTGLTSDFVRVAVGGEINNVSVFDLDDRHNKDWELGYGGNEEDIITGLRLVSITKDRNNVPETIVDPEGLTWYIVPSYYGSKNLNSKTKKYGDALYLYYTKDYTGRRLTITSPIFTKYYRHTEGFVLGDESLFTNCLGGVSTWSSSNSKAWDVECDALIEALACEVWSQTVADFSYDEFINHFDFVRLYDRDMKQTFGDDNNRPANFNRNGGGKKMFLSYTYVTPDDYDVWYNNY